MISHSQNYLNNRHIVKKMVESVDFGGVDLVIEIGPGKGAITDGLLESPNYSGEIILVEADADLCDDLRKKYVSVGQRVNIVFKDFLRYEPPRKPFIVVSNIPFNITADIVRKITNDDSTLQSAYLIVQKEAAKKFLGAPFAESPLFSHLLNPRYSVTRLFGIPRANYIPQPKYDTVFIKIDRRPNPIFIGRDLDLFRDFMVFIFGIGKPSIKKALRTVFSNLQVKIILDQLSIFGEEDIKKILFNEWVEIFKIFKKEAIAKSSYKINGSYSRLLLEQSKLHKRHRTALSFKKSYTKLGRIKKYHGARISSGWRASG